MAWRGEENVHDTIFGALPANSKHVAVEELESYRVRTLRQW